MKEEHNPVVKDLVTKERNPIVKDFVASALKELGYDGLFQPAADCSCLLGDDFMPCEGEVWSCEAGYRCDAPAVKCPGCGLAPIDYDYVICRFRQKP